MSDEETVEYSALEIILVDGEPRVHLEIADGDSAKDIAKIFNVMSDKDMLTSIATIMTTKILKIKGEAFCQDFLNAIREGLVDDDAPVIQPRDVIGRIVKAGGI